MRASRILLAVYVACFLGFAFVYVPRLTNPLWTDVQFTGWVAPFAHRILTGQRLYQDFTLPISPGSFVVMAAVQKVTGRYLLVDELWVCALCNLAMSLLGYSIARNFTTRWNSVLVAVITSLALVAESKQIAYDHLTLVVAWSMVALLVHGLTLTPGPRRRRLLAAAGAAATLTVGFKSSAGAGACIGLLLAMVVATALAFRRDGRVALEIARGDLAAVASGSAVGVVLDAALVWAVGGSLSEATHVIFVEGPRLKAVEERGLRHLLIGVFQQDSATLTIYTSMLVAWILIRGARHASLFQLPESPPDDRAFEESRNGKRGAALLAAYLVLAFGTAGVLLARSDPGPKAFHVAGGISIGAIMAAYLMFHLHVLGNALAGPGTADRRTAYVAAACAAWSIEAFQSLSAPEAFGVAFQAGVVVPIAWVALFTEVDRARSPIVKYGVFCLVLFQIYTPKFLRHVDARFPVEDPGFWAGLRVDEVGKHTIAAAERARTLAGPDGTVLPLPEDPMLGALVGRRRPDLRGGVVFVDQYPASTLARDTRYLIDHPPDVLILNPSDDSWKTFYRFWSEHSPAEQLQDAFLAAQRASYEVDSEYPVINGPRGWQPMKVLVRKHP